MKINLASGIKTSIPVVKIVGQFNDSFNENDIINGKYILEKYSETDTENDRKFHKERFDSIKRKATTLFAKKEVLELLADFNINGDDSFIKTVDGIILNVFAGDGEYEVSLHADQQTFAVFEKNKKQKNFTLKKYGGREKDIYKLAEQSEIYLPAIESFRKANILVSKL